jgi:hypothetical protein
MLLMIFWLVLRSCYQGLLFHLLQSDIREPEVASIQDMLKKNFKFYIYDSLESRTKGQDFYENRVIIKLSELESYRDKTLDSSFKGVVFNYLTQVLYENQINYRNFTYRICKEKFLINRMVFYFKKDFYLVDDFNRKIRVLNENGLINFWKSKYIDEPHRLILSDGPTPLKIDHLIGCFEVWTGGIFLCFFVFLIECLSKHFSLLKRLFI